MQTNYRGLYLTAVLSKIAERIIKIPFSKNIETIDGFGAVQLAFRKKRAALIWSCCWCAIGFLPFNYGEKMAYFWVTFRERSTELMPRVSYKSCSGLGFANSYWIYSMISSHYDWLVAVDGSLSFDFVLQNMIFKNTKLGPWLWNVYFADVHEAAERNCACERKFADDLNV